MTEGDDREPTERLPGTEQNQHPVEEAPPPPPSPPDLTDKLNKRLLTSFLDRLNNGQIAMLNGDGTLQPTHTDELDNGLEAETQ